MLCPHLLVIQLLPCAARVLCCAEVNEGIHAAREGHHVLHRPARLEHALQRRARQARVQVAQPQVPAGLRIICVVLNKQRAQRSHQICIFLLFLLERLQRQLTRQQLHDPPCVDSSSSACGKLLFYADMTGVTVAA